MVVLRRAGGSGGAAAASHSPSPTDSQSHAPIDVQDDNDLLEHEAIQHLEKRMAGLERKLDLVLQRLKAPR